VSRADPDAAQSRRCCAVYTRKSTDEGLEQAFNSLHAQREACEAYILSQRHEGWSLVPTAYDDGGLSGGTMARPGLQQLLQDVEAGRVDVIVVYKVDRLTRSLADFAKIVEVLDERGASFVSVTQAFNTTTSMGRLTLNVLLSFAQFEREVTGERIRDKIAASKARGIWMGGPLPLGYRVESRQLLPEPEEAERVRRIFALYLEVRSLAVLGRRLEAEGIRSKLRHTREGRSYGGVFMTRGALQKLLRNPIYVGRLSHKGTIHDGNHDGIVEEEIWTAAQAQLDGSAVARASRRNAQAPSLLAGKLSDGHGRPMSPSHAVRRGKRYRYYITHNDHQDERPTWRVPAHDLEEIVVAQLLTLAGDNAAVLALGTDSADPLDADRIGERLDAAAALGRALTSAEPGRQREAVHGCVAAVRLHEDRLVIALVPAALSLPTAPSPLLTARAAKVRIGQQTKLVIDATGPRPVAADPKLVRLIADAHAVQGELMSGRSLDQIAADRQSRRSAVTKLARLSFLAPEIVEAILAGAQPAALTRRTLLDATALPIDWQAQRASLGFA